MRLPKRRVGSKSYAVNIHLKQRNMESKVLSIEQEDLSKLIEEFKGHVINMIHDSHGNHVIQRCIQTQSAFAREAERNGDLDSADEIMDQLQFIIDDVIENIESLSVHRYGCRVVQRSIEYCVEKQRVGVLEAIITCNEGIVEDSYGNYVVQQAIITGTEMHREQILSSLIRKQGNIFRLSKQKFASNVVEKLMQHGTIEDRNLLLKEILKVRLSRCFINITTFIRKLTPLSFLFHIHRFTKELAFVLQYSWLRIQLRTMSSRRQLKQHLMDSKGVSSLTSSLAIAMN